MRSGKFSCKSASVSRAVWHVVTSCSIEKPSNSMCFNSCQKQLGNVSVPLSVHSDGGSVVVLEKIRLDYSTSPKSTPHGTALWVHLALLSHPRILVSPNPTILFINVSWQMKMNLVRENYSVCEVFVVRCSLGQDPLRKSQSLSMVGWL